MKNEIKSKLLVLNSDITPPQSFSRGETNFHFCQFLSNFLRYFSSNFPLFYPYNIFAIYFPSNFSLLKFFSSIISNFSCLLILALIFPSNSSTNSLTFPRFSFLSHISCFAVNPFQCTKYFSTLCTFLLFNIFSTFHSSTPSTSTGFGSSTLYPFTGFLYLTTLLTFTIR